MSCCHGRRTRLTKFVQMRTMAMQRAMPTRMRPLRRPSWSGRNAQERPSWEEDSAGIHGRRSESCLTMKRGATIQLTTRLKASWIQISRVRKTMCSFSYCTLHKMGYIMTRSPTAGIVNVEKLKEREWTHRWAPILPRISLSAELVRRLGRNCPEESRLAWLGRSILLDIGRVGPET